MAVSGAAYTFFVLTHMLGNLLIFSGAEAFNRYGHAIITNPLLPLAEAGLVLFLLLHAYYGMRLSMDNKNARGSNYVVSPQGAKAASLAAKSMIFSGSLILLFVVLHIITFKYGTFYSASYNGVEMRDLYKLVIEVFQKPGYVLWYTVCLVLLGLHLSHGVSSLFNTVGLNHPRYNCGIKIFGYAYAGIVTAGFVAIPLYVFFVVR